MKKIILMIALLSISCSSKAQIFDCYDNSNYGTVTNGYYKDLNNFQNQFIGTWVFQQGNTMLEVKFRKKEMVLQNPGPHQFYEDVLIGEYKYIDENGVEKVNGLANFSIEYFSIFNYSLYSGSKMENSTYPVCNECPIGTKRLYIHFDEPSNDDFGLDGAFVIRHLIENGIEKLHAELVSINMATNENKADPNLPSTFTEFSLPYGSYILVKQ